MRNEDAGYEARIERTMGQLRACRGDYRPIHESLDRKRQAWWETNRDALRLSGPLPRQAYTMFLLLHLGLDTRQGCREGTEESVQHLIARLDPRLHFSRNYVDGIRPYAPYCEESIELLDDISP